MENSKLGSLWAQIRLKTKPCTSRGGALVHGDLVHLGGPCIHLGGHILTERDSGLQPLKMGSGDQAVEVVVGMVGS